MKNNTYLVMNILKTTVLFCVIVFTNKSFGAVCSKDGWCWQNPVPHGNNMEALWGSSENDVFHVGGRGSIYHFDGTDWSPMQSGSIEDLHSVWGRGSDDVFAVGDRGKILHFNGVVWQSMVSGTDLHLRGIWGDSTSGMFAVGDQGIVLHFNGLSWRQINAGTTETLSCIWGSSPSNIFIGSRTSNSIFHFNGTQWQTMNTGLGVYDHVLSIWGSGGNNVYAVTLMGNVIRYQGGGNSWSEVQLPQSMFGRGTLTNIFGTHENSIYVSGAVNYHFDGSVWTAQEGINKYGWGVEDSNRVFWAGSDKIRFYDGLQWNEFIIKTSTVDFGLLAVWADNGGRAVAVGMGGGIAFRRNGVWENLNHTSWWDLNDVWGTSFNNIYAVGGGGTIFHYDGNIWSPMDADFSGTFSGVWGSGDSSVFAVGSNGHIYNYKGNRWVQIRSGGNNLNAVWGSGENDVFAVGEDGTILRYNGTSWSQMSHQFQYESLIDVWGTGKSNVYVLASYGKVLHYDGHNWSDISTGLGIGYLRSIHGSSASDIYVLEQNGVIHHYDGKRWKRLDGGSNNLLMDIFVDSAGSSYLVGGNTEILFRYNPKPPTPTPAISKPLSFIPILLQE